MFSILFDCSKWIIRYTHSQEKNLKIKLKIIIYYYTFDYFLIMFLENVQLLRILLKQKVNMEKVLIILSNFETFSYLNHEKKSQLFI